MRGVRKVFVVEAGPIDPETNAGDRACADLLDALISIGCDVHFHGLGSRGSVDSRLLESLRARFPQIAFSNNDGNLEKLFDVGQFDAAIVSRPGTALLSSPALAAHPELIRIFWGHDIHSRRLDAQQSVRGEPVGRASSMMAMVEARNWASFDLSVYPATTEANAVNEVAPGKGVAIPYFRLADNDLVGDASDFAPHGQRHGILMVGSSFHAPNADAVEWAITEILPLLQVEYPDASLTIVGDWSMAERKTLTRSGVHFTGVVTDEQLRRLHDEHLCLLAPLRFGAGTKRKVVAAMGLGLPVVTTDEGQRGVLVRDSAGQADGINLGNNPHSLASAVVRLHSDEQFWTRMAIAASTAVANVYRADAYDRALIDIIGVGALNRDQRVDSSRQARANSYRPSPQVGA